MRTHAIWTFERAVLLALGVSFPGACATQQGEFVPLSAEHPADPRAEPGWLIDVGATLTLPKDTAQPSGAKAGAVDDQAPKDVQQRIYACPMHPEVRSTTPGTCSICGMQLEEMKPKASVGEAPHGH